MTTHTIGHYEQTHRLCPLAQSTNSGKGKQGILVRLTPAFEASIQPRTDIQVDRTTGRMSILRVYQRDRHGRRTHICIVHLHIKTYVARRFRHDRGTRRSLIPYGREWGGAAGRAFMVARVLFILLKSCGNTITPTPRATIKALPTAPYCPRPYRR